MFVVATTLIFPLSSAAFLQPKSRGITRNIKILFILTICVLIKLGGKQLNLFSIFRLDRLHKKVFRNFIGNKKLTVLHADHHRSVKKLFAKNGYLGAYANFLFVQILKKFRIGFLYPNADPLMVFLNFRKQLLFGSLKDTVYIRNWIPMGIKIRASQKLIEPRYEFIRLDVFQLFCNVVHLIPMEV